MQEYVVRNGMLVLVILEGKQFQGAQVLGVLWESMLEDQGEGHWR